MFDVLVEQFVDEYKKSPRNKIHVKENLLLASVKEETGNETSSEELRDIVAKYIDGTLDEGEESIYDAAVYSCGLLARSCLGGDPEVDVDYELEWIINSDLSVTAEVRLS